MVANSSPGVDRIGSTYPGRRRWRWPKPRCNCRRSVGTQVPLGGPHLGPWAGPGPKIQMCIFNYDNYIEKKWVYTYTWNSHIVIKVFTLKEWWLFFAFLGDCDIIFQLCFVHCSLHCLCNNIVYYIYINVCVPVCVFNGAFLFALEIYLSLSHCCCFCCTGLNGEGMHINVQNRRNMYIHFSRLHKHISRILLPDTV